MPNPPGPHAPLRNSAFDDSPATRGAKILATLGPATSHPDIIAQLIAAGLDAARLNFSHADHATLAPLIARVRAAQRQAGKPLALIGDLQGPKIRIGELPEPLMLHSDSPVCIRPLPSDHRPPSDPPPITPSNHESAGPPGPIQLQTDYDRLPDHVQPGQHIYLKDGLIDLEVTAVQAAAPDPHVDALVRTGGLLTSRAGMNVPGVRLDFPALTEKDRADIRFAVEQRLDYLALSFVHDANDLRAARALLDELGSDIHLIAKIESAFALDHLPEILQAADGVMVARGDLGVEIGAENVPIWQRRIIDAAADALVPCIVATQMLESMTASPRPTRAEASDVANAVWEGTDAVMLSAETAVGRYPVECVAMMDRIIRRAEQSGDALHVPSYHTDWWRDPSRSISWAVRSIVEHNQDVQAVIAFTISGYTARLIAKDRMRVPVLVLAPNPSVEQRAALLWGVTPVHCPPPADLDAMLQTVDDIARTELGCDDGEQVVVAGGLPLNIGKPTNFLKLHAVGEEHYDSEPQDR